MTMQPSIRFEVAQEGDEPVVVPVGLRVVMVPARNGDELLVGACRRVEQRLAQSDGDDLVGIAMALQERAVGRRRSCRANRVGFA